MRKLIAFFTVASALVACRGGPNEPNGSVVASGATIFPTPQPQSQSDDAGCSASTPYPSGSVSSVTTLHFTTGGGDPGTDRVPRSLDITVTDVTQVQSIFTETNSLACLRTAYEHCPAGDAIDYRLTFSGSDGTFTFDIDPTGCGVAKANGVPYAEVYGNVGYWRDLAAALGVPEAELDGPFDDPSLNDP